MANNTNDMANSTNFSVQLGDWQLNPEPMRSIRLQVFVEEQQVPLELEWDNDDATAIHFLAYSKGRAIGTARLLDNGHIGRMAVLKDYRKQGVGCQLLKACEETALNKGVMKTRLNAQEQAIPFYEKHGYSVSSGKFMDAGIPHKTMHKKLSRLLVSRKS